MGMHPDCLILHIMTNLHKLSIANTTISHIAMNFYIFIKPAWSVTKEWLSELPPILRSSSHSTVKPLLQVIESCCPWCSGKESNLV